MADNERQKGQDSMRKAFGHKEEDKKKEDDKPGIASQILGNVGEGMKEGLKGAAEMMGLRKPDDEKDKKKK